MDLLPILNEALIWAQYGVAGDERWIDAFVGLVRLADSLTAGDEVRAMYLQEEGDGIVSFYVSYPWGDPKRFAWERGGELAPVRMGEFAESPGYDLAPGQAAKMIMAWQRHLETAPKARRKYQESEDETKTNGDAKAKAGRRLVPKHVLVREALGRPDCTEDEVRRVFGYTSVRSMMNSLPKEQQ